MKKLSQTLTLMSVLYSASLQAMPTVAIDQLENLLSDSMGNTITFNSNTLLEFADTDDAGNKIVFNRLSRNSDISVGEQLYLHDRMTGEITVISKNAQGENSNGRVTGGCISPNGRYVAFATNATDITPGISNGVYRVDLNTPERAPVLVSIGNNGELPDIDDAFITTPGCVSDNGDIVASVRSDSDSLALGETITSLQDAGGTSVWNIMHFGADATVASVINQNLVQITALAENSNPFVEAGSGIELDNAIAGFSRVGFPQISADGRTIAFQALTFAATDRNPDTVAEFINVEPLIYDVEAQAVRFTTSTFSGINRLDPIIENGSGIATNDFFGALSSNLFNQLISNTQQGSVAPNLIGGALFFGNPKFDLSSDGSHIAYSSGELGLFFNGLNYRIVNLEENTAVDVLADIADGVAVGVDGESIAGNLLATARIIAGLTTQPSLSANGDVLVFYRHANYSIDDPALVEPLNDIGVDIAIYERSTREITTLVPFYDGQTINFPQGGPVFLNGNHTELSFVARRQGVAEILEFITNPAVNNQNSVLSESAQRFVSSLIGVSANNSLAVNASQSQIDSITVEAITMDLDVTATDLFGLDVSCATDTDLLTINSSVDGNLFPINDAMRLDIGPSISNDLSQWSLARSLRAFVNADGEREVPASITGEGVFSTLTLGVQPQSGIADIRCTAEGTNADGQRMTIAITGASIVLDNGINAVGDGQNVSGVVNVPIGINPADVTVNLTIGDRVISTSLDENGAFVFADIRDGDIQISLNSRRAVAQCTNATVVGESVVLDNLELFRGDINENGEVDMGDFTFLARRYGVSEGEARFRDQADLNSDGTINIQDLSIMGGNFGLRDCRLVNAETPDITPGGFDAIITLGNAPGAAIINGNTATLTQSAEVGSLLGVATGGTALTGRRAIDIELGDINAAGTLNGFLIQPRVGQSVQDAVIEGDIALNDRDVILDDIATIQLGSVATPIDPGILNLLVQTLPERLGEGELGILDSTITPAQPGDRVRLVLDHDNAVLSWYINTTLVNELSIRTTTTGAPYHLVLLFNGTPTELDVGSSYRINTNVTPDILTPDILPWSL